MENKEKQNNYAFIDTNNLYLAIKHLGWKIDWFKFRKYLKNRFHIQKAFIIIGELQGYKDMYSIFSQAGFKIIFKKVIDRKNQTKGNVDIDIAVWVMHYLYNETFDKIMLITGDGDFYTLANYIKERNKLLNIAVPNKNSYSALLRKFSRVYVSEWNKKIEHKKR